MRVAQTVDVPAQTLDHVQVITAQQDADVKGRYLIVKNKLSKFNVIAHKDDNILIFNSLNNTFTILDKDYDIENSDEVDFLEKQGIIVNEDEDEDKKAFIKYINTCDERVLGITIMPTMACNFRCTYCYEDHEAIRMSDDVVEAVISFVKKKIKEVDRVSISWFGGEPTLCIDIIDKISTELIKICKFYRKPYTANMTTNGYFLDAALVKKFIKYRILSYQITLDGNKKEHDSIRFLANGTGTYDVIMKNLLDIRDNVSFPNVGVMLRINVTKETFEEFDTTIANLEKEFGDDMRFSFLFRRVGDWGGSSVKNISDNLIQSEDELTLRLLNYHGSLRLSSQFTEYGPEFGVCYAGKTNHFVINPKGEVLKCTVNLDSPGNVVGKLGENGEFHTNKNLNKWRYVGGSLNYKPEKCEGCAMWANCFNNTCTSATIKKRVTSTPICNQLERSLILMYKSYPGMFRKLG